MNKHEEVRKSWNKIQPILTNKLFELIGEKGDELVLAMIDVSKALEQAEATEKRLQQLEQDVKRYLELLATDKCTEEWNEYNVLLQKLLKVGAKDE